MSKREDRYFIRCDWFDDDGNEQWSVVDDFTGRTIVCTESKEEAQREVASLVAESRK